MSVTCGDRVSNVREDRSLSLDDIRTVEVVVKAAFASVWREPFTLLLVFPALLLA